MDMPGYSGTPLPRKLGVKPGNTIVLLNAPAGFESTLGPLPQDVTIRSRLAKDSRLIMLFCKDAATLARSLASAASRLHADGALWISWPKKSSRLFVDLTEDGIRAACLPLGLVDVKVCAVTDDWSGLKLMVRKENRAAWTKQALPSGRKR